MTLSDEILNAIRTHANETGERECCGVILTHRRRIEYVPMRNIATQDKHFIIHPQDYVDAEDKGKVLAIVHSHPKVNAKPSQADLVGIEKTQLPWVIVNWPTGQYTITEPSGYVAPLEGREFSHGILDCYTIVRDYYQRELGITLNDYERPDKWWLKGMDLYRDNIANLDFIEVKDGSLKLHDFLLIQMASPVANHGAIYLGDSTNMILHHVQGKISGRDMYGGYWRKATRAVLRHKDLF
jgi:proteasome lid subunit RPN8/RPN11